MTSPGLEKIEEHAKNIAIRESCMLYDLELVGSGGNRILRVFIDKEDGQGVSIDDCSNVSRALDLLLDVEDLVPGGAYQLEVSSPGLERKLRRPWHFKRAVGENVQCQLKEPLGDICESLPASLKKAKKLSGRIEEVSDSELVLKLDKGDYESPLRIPFGKLHKAKVVFNFENNYTPKKNRKN